MLWHRRRRSAEELTRLLETCRSSDVTYEPIGGSLGGPLPAGCVRRSWARELDGVDAFERAREAIRAWAIHRGAGLAVAIDGPLVVGTNVALDAPLPVGWVHATCRVVCVVDEPSRSGFAYGTLPLHPELGEESFVVHRRANGPTTFEVVAVSRPSHPLARLAPKVADRLQNAAVGRYLAAMADAVRSECG
jgi:uncharacterized protein (UPF0548 family)